MELISMVDFVLMQDGNLSQNDEDRWFKSHQYAEFLKQPLELWMFVPCDDDGNVWKYPPTKDEWEWAKRDSTEAEQSFEQKEYNYNKAKDKVLFEDCITIDKTLHKDIKRFFINLKHKSYLRIYSKLEYHTGEVEINFFPNFSEIPTVEYLVRYGLTLTQSAIKQII